MRNKVTKPYAFTMRLTADEKRMLDTLKPQNNISLMFREYLYYMHLNYKNNPYSNKKEENRYSPID